MSEEVLNILIVEDDVGLREIVSQRLRDAGYRVVEASNGREGLEILQKTPSSWFALITDYTMPYVNGGELVRRVRELGIYFEIVIMASAVGEWEPVVASAF